MSQGIILVTKDLEIPIINTRCVELLELPPDFVSASLRFDELVDYQTKRGEFTDIKIPKGLKPIDHFGPGNASAQFDLYERTRPNGTVLEIRSTRLPDGGFVRTFTDVTQRRQVQAHVTKLASEDALTGLANRRLFRSELENVYCGRQAGAIDTAVEFAILCLDLDRFKAVNDTLGHPIGDLLLQAVAQRLKASLRPTDILARLGGDEFAVLLPAIQSRKEPSTVASRLVAVVSKPYEIGGHQIVIGVSVGVAVWPTDAMQPDDLMVAADLALYSAKSNGRGTH